LELNVGPAYGISVVCVNLNSNNVCCALFIVYSDCLCGCLGAWQTVSQHNDKGIQDVDSWSSDIKYF